VRRSSVEPTFGRAAGKGSNFGLRVYTRAG
jgi:hypothetical protein